MIFDSYYDDVLALSKICGEQKMSPENVRLFNYIHPRYFPSGLHYFSGEEGRNELGKMLKEAGISEGEDVYGVAMKMISGQYGEKNSSTPSSRS